MGSIKSSRFFKTGRTASLSVSTMSYSREATCRFNVASWSENLVTDIDGKGTRAGDAYYPDRGVTRTEVGYTYTGDIEGTSTLVYLIAYKADAAPVFGLERFEGAIGGHEGTCVFQHIGSQDQGSVSARIEVVPGMGTGGLEGLRGEADLSIGGHSDDGYELVLSYDVG
ncbi:hypothetical protein BH20ACT23_BH20ACT23_01750 [soil metagenome]